MGWARVREVKVQARGSPLAPPPLPSPPSRPPPPATPRTPPGSQGLPSWHAVCGWVVIKYIYLQFLELAHHPRLRRARNTARFVPLAAAGPAGAQRSGLAHFPQKFTAENGKAGFPPRRNGSLYPRPASPPGPGSERGSAALRPRREGPSPPLGSRAGSPPPQPRASPPHVGLQSPGERLGGWGGEIDGATV